MVCWLRLNRSVTFSHFFLFACVCVCVFVSFFLSQIRRKNQGAGNYITCQVFCSCRLFLPPLNPITPRAVLAFRGEFSPLGSGVLGQVSDYLARDGQERLPCLPPAVFKHRSYGKSRDAGGGEADNSERPEAPGSFHCLRTSGLTAAEKNKKRKKHRRQFESLRQFKVRRSKRVASRSQRSLTVLDLGRFWGQALESQKS